MDDLFRFLLLRPANRAASGDINALTAASFLREGMTRDAARHAAQAFLDGSSPPATLNLVNGLAALAVAKALRGMTLALAQVSTILQDATGKSAAQIVADPSFGSEYVLLCDWVVAIKLVSNSSGADAPELAAAIQGYDAIRLASSGTDPMSLRVLSIPDYPATAAPPPRPPPGPAPTPPGPADAATALRNIEAAIATLGALPASAFLATGAPELTIHREPAAAAPRRAAAAPTPTHVAARPWVLSTEARAALPETVRGALTAEGLDLSSQPLPWLLTRLYDRRAELQAAIAATLVLPLNSIIKIGNSYDTVQSSDYVGDPTAPPPTGHGNIRPVGIADLLMVKEHVLRYEGGELAHVENVLKSETLSRNTRHLDRTEISVVQETETTTEQTKDTQTTDRFSLKSETSDTIKNDTSMKAGLSVDASYGPTVEVKANADFATSTASESARKQASEFSRDVVARSVSKMTERVLQRRSVTTLTEFEETYAHGFDNTKGTAHISGYYQWIDKVSQAQVYNYGKRLMFDVIVPEPGTNYALALTHSRDVSQALEKPVPFTATAADINEGNYVVWAKRYDATGLDPPPAPIKTIVKVIDGVFSQDYHESSKSDIIALDDGYRAKWVSFVKDAWITETDPQWRVFVGTVWFDAIGAQQYANLAGEISAIGFAYDAHNVNVLSASIEIFCERTERAFAAWQAKTHATITQAFQAKMQIYDQALDTAKAAAETVIAGRNPAFNLRITMMELRRQCLTLITAQQFDWLGALELSTEGYTQPNLVRTAEQMPYIRFFEQAFEWEHLVYFFYPYFWGWKAGWKNRMLLDDVDPAFGDFLRAGAARLVFPVRPGFEAAVIHYIETGEIWNGGPPPDVSSPLYVSIVKEIQEATGAPGTEQPEGDPWEIRTPTTLVRLRPNDDLPAWKKVGEVWQPAN